MKEPCIEPDFSKGSLRDRVKLFNTFANTHQEKQSVNPFSGEPQTGNLQKRTFSKEEYGRPVKGSLTEYRGFKANLNIYREMLQLCEIINSSGEPLYEAWEKKNDPRKVISFGELFNIYTIVSDKLVGVLLRARKHKLLDFEGECLFQKRDDHVPIILAQDMPSIRRICKEKINTITAALKAHEEPERTPEPEDEP